MRDKVFKSGITKFFKGCLPQNLLSPLLNTLSHICFPVSFPNTSNLPFFELMRAAASVTRIALSM